MWQSVLFWGIAHGRRRWADVVKLLKMNASSVSKRDSTWKQFEVIHNFNQSRGDDAQDDDGFFDASLSDPSTTEYQRRQADKALTLTPSFVPGGV
jgi:hypothetical protein